MDKQYEQIKAQFQNRIYSYAFYSLRIAADAEDIVQEAFIRLWQHWPQVELTQVGNWLMRVSHNLVIDHIRRQQARPRTTEAELDEFTGSDEGLDQNELRIIVEASIAKVAEPYRTTLIMREIQGLPYQDISEVLGISLDHVRTNIFRAKGKLREQVKLHPLYSPDLLQETNQ